MLKDTRLSKSAAGGKGMEILNWVFIGVIIIVIVLVMTKIFKSFKLGADTAGEIAGGVLIQQATGITPARQTVCRSVARECENSLYRVPFIGTIAWIDHNRMILSLNSLVTDREATYTSEVFKQIKGLNSLRDIVENKMQSQNQARIKSVIRENLV